MTFLHLPSGPPQRATPRGERVLHLALRDRATDEAQPALEGALRALGSKGYQEIDWLALPLAQVEHSFLEACRTFQPTLVFAQIQTEGVLTPSAIAGALLALPPGAVVCQWNGDLRERADHASMRWQLELGQAGMLTLVSNAADPAWLAAAGAPAAYLQIGYDPGRYTPDGPRDRGAPGVVFLGANYAHLGYDGPLRQELAIALYEELDGDFAAYGSGWKGPWARGHVFQDQEAALYRSAKVAVGLSLHNNVARYTSDRAMRALGSGAIYAAKAFPGMEAMGFKAGVNCLVWTDLGDLVAQVRGWVDTKAGTPAEVAMRAAAVATARGRFTWGQRMEELTAIVAAYRQEGESNL
jgi:hypothetical protein